MATVVPLLVGGDLAIRSGQFWWWAWLDILLIAFLMQIGANMLNEYFDYTRGLDNEESLGIGGIIVSGEVQARTVLLWALMTYALAFVLGMILVAFRGWVLLAMGFLGLIAGFIYAGTSHPVSSTPFGELLVALIMGPIEMLSTQFAASGVMTLNGLLLSIPVGLSVATILLANNLRDYVKDMGHGRHTLPIVLGRKGGYITMNILVSTVLLWITAMTLFRMLPITVLIIWLVLPVAIKNLATLRHTEMLPKAVPIAGSIHVIIGILLTVGLLW